MTAAPRVKHGLTGADLQSCFRAVSEGDGRKRSYDVPDLEDCERAATNITEIASWLAPTAEMPLSVTRLLRNAESLPPQISKATADLARCCGELPSPADELYRLALGHLASLNGALKGLQNVTRRARRVITWHELADSIALRAEALWRGPPLVTAYDPKDEDPKYSGQAPKSFDPGGPVVSFTVLVLGKLGVERSEEAVSAALRGRRGPRARTLGQSAPKKATKRP